MVKEKAQKMLEEVAAPNTTVLSKEESRLMQFIAFVLRPVNPKFLKSYITTIGNKIYVPTEFWNKDEQTVLEVLAHEGIHTKQSQKFSLFLWAFLYLFPLSLAPLAFVLLALFGHWIIGLVLTLVLLVPLPAWFRMKLEVEAYVITSLFRPSLDRSLITEYIVEQLSGRWYYFAWPFKSHLRKTIEKQYQLTSTEEIYQPLIKWLQKQ